MKLRYMNMNNHPLALLI